MSRSYRKSPICGSAADSDKPYKKQIHRKQRRKDKIKIKQGNFDELGRNIPYDSWSSPKDGKSKFFILKKIDPKLYRKLMRK